MIQINIGDHRSPIAGYVPIPVDRRSAMRWARTKARWIARNKSGADPYFRGLPDGNSLTELLADRTIWINYHSSMSDWGESIQSGKEIAISVTAFRAGRWSVLATLIHELTHINGVGGAGTAAEDALIPCGLGNQSEKDAGVDDPSTPYDPGIIGYRLNSKRRGSYA